MVFLQISLGMYYFVKYFFGNMLFFLKKTHQNLSIFVKMVELVLDFANECWWYNNDELLNTSYFLFFSTCYNIGVHIIFLCVYIVGLSLIHWNSCWLVLSQQMTPEYMKYYYVENGIQAFLYQLLIISILIRLSLIPNC